jgi:hypothetical protein
MYIGRFLPLDNDLNAGAGLLSLLWPITLPLSPVIMFCSWEERKKTEEKEKAKLDNMKKAVNDAINEYDEILKEYNKMLDEKETVICVKCNKKTLTMITWYDEADNAYYCKKCDLF